MGRIVRVFCTGQAQEQIAKRFPDSERYDGFVVAKVSQEALRQLSRKYPVDDMTDLYTIRVGERRMDTSRPRLDAKGKPRPHPAYKKAKPLPPGPHHHLVQFIGPIKSEWLREVKRVGGEPRAPHANFTYVVRADDKALRGIMALPFVRWAGHLPHEDRVAPSVSPRIGRTRRAASAPPPGGQVLPGTYVVEFFGPGDLAKALAAVKQLGCKILDKEPKARILIVEAQGGAAQRRRTIAGLAAIHGVRAIREWSLARTCSDTATTIMGAGITMGNRGLRLSGSGEYIGVCDTGLDTGDPRNIHPDFAGRLARIKSYPIRPTLSDKVNNPGANDGPADAYSGHGTHVAGCIVGSGAASRGLKGKGLAGPIRGLAYRARLIFQAVQQKMEWKRPALLLDVGPFALAGIPNDLQDLFSDAYRSRARIHSNSWSRGAAGDYDEQCTQLDDFVWKHKDFCVLVSAGNDGMDRNGRGKVNFMSVTPPGTARNCITVGACENRRPNFGTQTYATWDPRVYRARRFRNDSMADNPAQVAPFSSRGPTLDGRVKPDVVAPGTFVLSTRSRMIARTNDGWAAFPWNPLYFYLGGTSQAAPLTAGAVALVREYLRKKKRIRRPTAALLKATLIVGATRLPGYAPAGAVLDDHQGFGRVNLAAVLAPPKPASSTFVEVKPGLRTGEVHAIQIKLKSRKAPLRITLAYSDFPGEHLVNNLNLIVTAPDKTKYIGNQSAGKPPKFDAKNNVEVVHVQKPGKGTWRIEVVGSDIRHGPQDFALVYTAHV